jgi:hypothetical protein
MSKKFWGQGWRGVTHTGPGYEIGIPDPDMEFVRRVLKVFSDARVHEDLLWHMGEEGPILFMADVSDTFFWGSADGEDIRPSNVHILERAYQDLALLGQEQTRFVTMLFAARIRGCRPLRRLYDQHADVAILLDACAPDGVVDAGEAR